MLDAQPRPTVRTLVASFLFTDLVGFSKGTATDQYAAKAKLSGVLRRHLAPLKEEDYWIKDTGDGALIAFVSNPEHALYMALALGEDYAAGASQTSSGSLRTGLHLGTVKESIDVEARRNFIGDGINAAQRIMDFALPGQITASRAFFEAIGNLDAAYAALFAHVGAANDKHGRAHDLYTVSPDASVLHQMREDLAAAAGTLAPSVPAPSPTTSASATASRSGGVRRPLVIVAVIVAFAAIAATWWLRDPSTGTPSPPTVGAHPTIEAPSVATKAPDVSPPSSSEAPTPTPQVAVPAADTASPPTLPREELSRRDAEPRRAAVAPAPRATQETRPRAAAPATASESKPAASASPRCTRIVEKAALGEPLTAEEKRELASCR